VIISDFKQFGARHPEAGTLRNVLDYLGVTAPHSGRPYSEQLLFGLGGGLGFGYFLFERNGAHVIHLETRIHTRETEQPEFVSRICGRIGASVQLVNSSSGRAADANLKRLLGQGRPPLISVDPLRLSYLGLTTPLQSYYSVIAYGFAEDSGRVMLSDRCGQPVSAGYDEFRQARQTSWSPKFRAVVVGRPEREPDVRAAVVDGIRDCCLQMREGLGIANFGLRGLEKWATVLTSTREKKSWSKIYPPGPSLFEALYSLFVQIAARSGTGNGQRAYYAEFLDEAAEVLSKPDLREVANQYRECDRLWGEVADGHLPDAVPVFAEVKELARRRMCLFETRGANAAQEIQAIHGRLSVLEKEAAQNFPLSVEDVRGLFGDLRARILRLQQAESEALRGLESAIAA
jgi:hypothetical protein